VSSDNTALFVNKVSLLFTSLGAFNYKISWSYVWSLSTNSNDFHGRIVGPVSGITLDIQIEEPTQAGSFQFIPSSGFAYFSYPLSTTETWELQFKSSLVGVTANISQAKLEIIRVS
jgi:hypothetical protein